MAEGLGVLKAIESVNGEIFDTLSGRDVEDQVALDNLMIELDGTNNKDRLGANAILAVSIALAKAAAEETSQPLYTYIGGLGSRVLPIPIRVTQDGCLSL